MELASHFFSHLHLYHTPSSDSLRLNQCVLTVIDVYICVRACYLSTKLQPRKYILNDFLHFQPSIPFSLSATGSRRHATTTTTVTAAELKKENRSF